MNDLEKLDKIWDLLDEVEVPINSDLYDAREELFAKLNSFTTFYRKIDKEKMELKLEKWQKTFA